MFCMREGLIPLAENIWVQRLKQKFVCESTTVSVDGGRIRGFQGIELRME